jgi:hypothetical protein
VDDTTPIMPTHIEGTVAAITEMHAQHRREASAYQRIIDKLTALLGRPAFVGVITVAIALTSRTAKTSWCVRVRSRTPQPHGRRPLRHHHHPPFALALPHGRPRRPRRVTPALRYLKPSPGLFTL